jgi:HSP20 family protein
MGMKTLFPWVRDRPELTDPMMHPSGEKVGPFLSLHREVNRLFDDFMRGFDFSHGKDGPTSLWPQVDVAETDKEVKVTAELPGMDSKDVEVTLHDGVLTLKGEKKVETTEQNYRERWHGQFLRSFQLGSDVDPDKVLASFADGVLTVTVEKKPEDQRTAKRIPITR